MVDLNIELPAGFLNEEERCGYNISSEMKKVWAVQLDLLNKLDEVCRKHGLVYYADSGTLLGVVRHKGYIPWDDDIDIVMMRKDYNRLLELEDEFKNPYFLQSAYSEKNYIRAHAQLRNSETTGCIQADVDTTYNKGVFVDIFPIDNIPDDEAELERFRKKIARRWKILTVVYPKHHNPLVRFGASLISLVFPYKTAFKRYERLCQQYNGIETLRVGNVAYGHAKEKNVWCGSWFKRSISVPFEFMSIPIPEGYDERLKKEYGDYMVVKRVSTTHGGLFLSADIPYAEYFSKETEKPR